MTNETLQKRLLKATGSKNQRDLARKLGVSQNCVWRWIRVGHVSASGAIALERLTKGAVSATDLRREYDKEHGRIPNSGAGKKTRATERPAA